MQICFITLPCCRSRQNLIGKEREYASLCPDSIFELPASLEYFQEVLLNIISHQLMTDN